MLVVKCPQCARSYRLAESLYRRKAAGYGVVITCRHCKTQIHVDEGTLPRLADDAGGSAYETAEGDTANPPDVAEHDAATRSDPNAADPVTNPPPADVDAMTNPPAADLDPVTNPPAADVDAVTNPPAAGANRAPAINLKAADANEVAAAVAAIEAAVERMGATPAAPRAENGSSPTNPIVPPVVAKNDTGTPALPKVAPKPAAFAPRPAGSPPRPAGSPPRPGGSATATPMPIGASATATPMPTGASATATPMPGKAMPLVVKKPHVEAPSSPGNPKPKLVALSPGLLGVGTALKQPSPKPAPVTDQAADSAAPMSVPDSALFEVDAEPISKPPDSTMPIDTLDYVESEPPAAPPPKGPPPREPPKRDGADAKAKADAPVAEAKPEKRLPQAPPMRKQHVAATAGEAKPGEVPSETGTPKMAELALGSSPLPLSQKKGEPKRKRQPSGDLTDELLGTDIGFDAPPALAPPDAAALTRAPVSSRRPGAVSKADSVKPGAQASTKAPVSSSTTSEKKGTGRGFVLLLLAAALGGGVYFFRQRLPEASSEPPRPEAAVNAPAVKEPEPAPVAEPPAATGTEAEPPTAPPAPEASAAAPTTAATPTTPGATATSPTTEATPSPTPAKAATARPASTTTTAPTAEAQVAAPKPTTAPTPTPTTPPTTKSTAVIEPRGAVGTEPFDVAAARSALDTSAAHASGCRKPGDPSGVAVVTITFSQTGRVTTANISGPPFQATPTGGCIASTMRKTRVPAFAGDMVTVRKTITVQ
jgi:hypothetical protein